MAGHLGQTERLEEKVMDKQFVANRIVDRIMEIIYPTLPAAEQQNTRVRWHNIVLEELNKAPGPTGDFPKGKMNEEDEGGLTIAIGIEDGNVVIRFGKKVAWLGLGREETKSLAESLLKYAQCLPK